MDEVYDVIVLGTGLIECVLAGLLSIDGKRVLVLDRNRFYGGENPSVSLLDLFKTFKPSQQPPEQWGSSRYWNIDLVPKFTMDNGRFGKVILHTGRVADYLQWKPLDGTYVLQMHKEDESSSTHAQIHKIPTTDTTALKSSLMELWEKKRCKKFFNFIANYDTADRATWGDLDLQNSPFSALITKFSLEKKPHAAEIYSNARFMNTPALEALQRIKLYMDSAGLYGNSPFIYPVYGTGGISEGFSRLCAIYGATFMLSKSVDEILFNEEGKVTGIRSGEERVQAPMILCDPSYVLPLGKVRVTGKVVRAICILNHPIPQIENITSCQIVIPQRQVSRRHDIYVTLLSASHCVCPENYYVVTCSTEVETDTPEAELQPAYALLGEICDSFVRVYDKYEPIGDGRSDNLFISKYLDATSHFESAVEDILSLYERISGEPLNYEQSVT